MKSKFFEPLFDSNDISEEVRTLQRNNNKSWETLTIIYNKIFDYQQFDRVLRFEPKIQLYSLLDLLLLWLRLIDSFLKQVDAGFLNKHH